MRFPLIPCFVEHGHTADSGFAHGCREGGFGADGAEEEVPGSNVQHIVPQSLPFSHAPDIIDACSDHVIIRDGLKEMLERALTYQPSATGGA